MPKAFSVASWNVDNLGKNDSLHRINPVVQFVAAQNADIVALSEVVNIRPLYGPLREAMPDYSFHLTEGPQMQEILIGVRSGLSVFVTQKLEFKTGQTTLRPGVLVTPRVNGKHYPVLFLHLKSFADPKGFGLRDDMIRRAYRFRGPLDTEADGKANYLFVGDLNTMGLDYPYTAHDISAMEEIKELKRRSGYRDMLVLEKTAEYTWWNGVGSDLPKGDFDHVVAAEHLQFKLFSGKPIDVRGWAMEIGEAAQDAWIKSHSDHSLLYFEVQQV